MAENGDETVLVDDEVLRRSYSRSELRFLKTHVSDRQNFTRVGFILGRFRSFPGRFWVITGVRDGEIGDSERIGCG